MADQNSQFYAILTNVGAAKQANADALGIAWKITQMGIGDANGAEPTPNATQTSLIAEWRRAPLNQLKVDDTDNSIIVAEQVIPADEGGKWIREIGLYDADGDLVAIANCPPTYKPLLSQGSGRTQIVRMNLVVSSSSNVELKIDPSVVLATREWVTSELAKQDFKHSVVAATTANIVLSGLQTIDGVVLTAGARVLVKNQTAGKENGLYVVASAAWARTSDADISAEVTPGMLVLVERGTVNADSAWQLVTDAPIVLGTTALTYEMAFGRTGVVAGTYRSVTVDAYGRVVAATSPTTVAGYGLTDVYTKTQMDTSLALKAPLASPALSGVPTAPTPAAGTNTTQLANTAFVQAAIAALVSSSPAALDTLNELAAALGNDPNFSTTMMNALAGKAAKATTLAGYGIVDAYTKAQDDAFLAAKADKGTTLAAYGIVDSYTQSQANSLLAAKAPLASPVFTGTPSVPTAAAGTNSLQAASTAFVQSAIAALVASSPTALDTLQELAAAIGNDPNFATTMLNALASKANKATTLGGYGIVDGVKVGDYGLGTPLVLSGGTDLNTVTQPGIYLFGSGAALVNAPITGASYVMVRGSAVYPHQELRRIYQNRVFVRAAKVANPTSAASDWMDWDEVLTTGGHVQATTAEAQEGVSNSTWMSPLRVYQALRAAAFRCTEAAWGVIRLATQDETDAGALDVAAVTPLKLKKHSSIGVGQTWQNVLASRALNTTYTNTTGRPIMVHVSLTDQGAYLTEITVGGVLIGSWDQPSSIKYTQTFLVPPGGTYMVSGNGGSAGGNTLTLWTELR